MQNIIEPFSSTTLYTHCQDKVTHSFLDGLCSGYISGYEDSQVKEYHEFRSVITCICEYWYAIGYELGYDVGYDSGYKNL